jgi:hypothetical protein
MSVPFIFTTTTESAVFRMHYPFSQLLEVNLSNRAVTTPTGGVNLYPNSFSFYAVGINTGVTASALNDSTTTVSFFIRETASSADLLFSATTKPFEHNYNEILQGYSIRSMYFCDFVVTSSSNSLRDLCRQSLASSTSLSLVGAFKIEQADNRVFTSNTFAINCVVPVIRDLAF